MNLCKYFLLFLVVAPIAIIFLMICISWLDGHQMKKIRSVAQWREDNLKAQEKMRRDSDWYD